MRAHQHARAPRSTGANFDRPVEVARPVNGDLDYLVIPRSYAGKSGRFKGLISSVAMINPLEASMAAIYPSDVGSPLPATRAFTAKSAKCPAAPMSNGNTRSPNSSSTPSRNHRFRPQEKAIQNDGRSGEILERHHNQSWDVWSIAAGHCRVRVRSRANKHACRQDAEDKSGRADAEPNPSLPGTLNG